jgi:hypothetical protein
VKKEYPHVRRESGNAYTKKKYDGILKALPKLDTTSLTT